MSSTPATFVHLSDIHFGQEQGSKLIVHNDVKERLIDDAATLVGNYAAGTATGIIVTGDITFSGKHAQYQQAAEWLDRLSLAVGCEKTDVQVVPGNHDINRDAISSGCKLMLGEIFSGGEEKLDVFLNSPHDREVLYARFDAYRPFAEGYGCPLDREGGFESKRTVELATARTLRFVGLNSALICSDRKDEKGHLLLGARQRVLPRTAGEELVVLCHHPLDWLKDSADARRYVRSRARIFICGHEHSPSLEVERVEVGCDLMMLAAGATVPDDARDGYNFTYNLLLFDWHEGSDGLKVTIFPRAWSAENTRFETDDESFPTGKESSVLGCPNFRNSVRPVMLTSRRGRKDNANAHIEGSQIDDRNVDETMSSSYPLVRLQFFRDLSPNERIVVLVKLGVLPKGSTNFLTHNILRQLVDALIKTGRLEELRNAIEEVKSISSSISGNES